MHTHMSGLFDSPLGSPCAALRGRYNHNRLGTSPMLVNVILHAAVGGGTENTNAGRFGMRHATNQEEGSRAHPSTPTRSEGVGAVTRSHLLEQGTREAKCCRMDGRRAPSCLQAVPKMSPNRPLAPKAINLRHPPARLLYS